MTREDAIDYVQAAFDAYESEFSIGDDWSKEHEARDMAIQALSQEPTNDKCHYCEHNFTPYKGNTGEFTEQEPSRGWEEMTVPCENCGHDMTFKIAVCGEQEPCDDVISRQDAIKAQCEACDICGNMRYTKCQYFMQGCNEVKCLRDLPSVTQKSGKWITLDYQRSKFECSECHTQGYVDTCMYEPKWKYCPICGAEMESEE